MPIGYTYTPADPDDPFVSTGACNMEVPDSNPGRAGYLPSWLCIGLQFKG